MKLVDSDEGHTVSWPVGAIIKVGDNFKVVVGETELPVIDPIPENFCVDLIE